MKLKDSTVSFLIVMNTKLIQNIVNLYSTLKIIFLGISFKITERKSGTFYMIQNNFFGSIIRRLYKMQPFYIYIITKKSSVKHMKLAKNGDVWSLLLLPPPSILILWASQGREGTYNIFSCTLHNIINGRER